MHSRAWWSARFASSCHTPFWPAGNRTQATVAPAAPTYNDWVLRDHLVTPDAQALQAFFERHFRSGGQLLLVAAHAEVQYVGRAASLAEAGQYLLFIKADGSLQIHGPRGVKPVNWQPRTDDLRATVQDGCCVLRATRRSPEETVTVTFLEVSHAQAVELADEAGFLLAGTEAQMQGTLARHPDLLEPGLTVLDRELLTHAGGIDLYARDAQGRHVVIELKRGTATQDAVHQLQRYVQAVRAQVTGEVRGVIASPSITKPAALQLERLGFEHKAIHALPSMEETSAQPGLF